MSIRDEQLERISNALNKPIGETRTRLKELNSKTLNQICDLLELNEENTYLSCDEARNRISSYHGADRCHSQRQPLTWELLEETADTLHNL